MQAPWCWSKTETCRSDIYLYFHVNFNVFFLINKSAFVGEWTQQVIYLVQFARPPADETVILTPFSTFSYLCSYIYFYNFHVSLQDTCSVMLWNPPYMDRFCLYIYCELENCPLLCHYAASNDREEGRSQLLRDETLKSLLLPTVRCPQFQGLTNLKCLKSNLCFIHAFMM